MRSIFILLSACFLGGWPASANAAEQTHILCIMTDDMGWKDLHCQGNDVLSCVAKRTAPCSCACGLTTHTILSRHRGN